MKNKNFNGSGHMCSSTEKWAYNAGIYLYIEITRLWRARVSDLFKSSRYELTKRDGLELVGAGREKTLLRIC